MHDMMGTMGGKVTVTESGAVIATVAAGGSMASAAGRYVMVAENGGLSKPGGMAGTWGTVRQLGCSGRVATKAAWPGSNWVEKAEDWVKTSPRWLS